MNKKTKIAIIGIIALVLVTIGVTYAYWLITRTQQGENVITTGCLDITLNGSGDITLVNQFPMSDEDGMKLTPYTFTVTNNCNTSVDYQVALEALEAGDEIASNAIKVALNDSSKLYSEYSELDTTVSNAYESRRLGFSKLSAKGSEGATDTWELRIWIDEDAPISEMSTAEIIKNFKGKITVTIGQGIENVFSEDTLAYHVLANIGGMSNVSSLNYVVSKKETTYGVSTEEEPYYWADSYESDLVNGKYILTGNIIQATLLECIEGTKECPKYYASSEETDTMYEFSSFSTNEIMGETYYSVKAINYSLEYPLDIKRNDGEYSVYSAEDDLGISYFITGDIDNNYVKFGTWQKADGYNASSVSASVGEPMYWRIVRINGDGTIRLAYDGTSAVENSSAHTAIIGKVVYDNNGYIYEDSVGTTVVSNQNVFLDDFYSSNLHENYGDYIADGIFCSDNTGGATERIMNNKRPSLKCVNAESRYTMSTKIGNVATNGKLTYPIGLLSADEYALASGEIFEGDLENFLGQWNDNYQLMTPGWHIIGASGDYLFNDGTNITDPYGVRPVINIKADVKFTGNGTKNSPYEIAIN